jgi:superfamily II DNA or RNA helicase
MANTSEVQAGTTGSVGVLPPPEGAFGVLASEGVEAAAAALVEGAEQYLSEVNTAYMATLRILARARHIENPADRRTWEATPENVAAVELPGAERVSRYLAMARNAEAYKEQLASIGLRNDQLEPFELLLKFVGMPGRPDQPYASSLRELVANVVGGGFSDLPTGSGKTGLMAKMAQALGIGNQPTSEAEGRKLKGLTLVPSLEILKQTQGEAVQEGYAKFAPEIGTSLYYGERKDLGGDMVIMTYQSFIQAVQKGEITREMFDIVFADEAHHLLAKETRASLEEFCSNELRVIGFTATSEYDEDRKLSQLLHHKICEIHIRDLVDIGVLSAVQLLAVATNEELRASGSKGDFTEAELRGLMYSQARNDQVVDWMEAMVLDGRQVLTYALRGKGPKGESCWHAHHLEELAAERGLVIKALDSTTMTQAEVDAILDDWNNKRIDGLVVVDKLREGWSSKNVGAVIDAAPTASKVVEAQRVGRGTRPNDDEPVTVYITFIDRIYGGKEQVTPWHIFNEPTIDPKKIIGRVPPKKAEGSGAGDGPGGGSGRRSGAHGGEDGPRGQAGEPGGDGQGGAPAGGIDTDNLPGNLADQLDVPYTIIDELLIRSKLEGDDYRYPTPEEVAFVDTVQYWRGMEMPTVIKLLEANGFNAVLARGPRGPRRYVHRDAAEFLKNYELPPIATAHQYTAHEAAPVIGLVAYSTVQKLAERMNIGTVMLRTKGQRMLRPHYTESDVLRMAEVIKEMRTFREGDEAVAEIAADYNLYPSAILHFAATAKPPIATDNFKYLPASGKRAAVVDMYDAARIRMHFETTLVTDDNGRKTREMLAAELGLSPGTTARVAKAMGLSLTRGRRHDPERERIVKADFWYPDEVVEIKAVVQNKGDISLNTLIANLEEATKARQAAVAAGDVAAGETVTIVVGGSEDEGRATRPPMPPGWASAAAVATHLRCSPPALAIAATVSQGAKENVRRSTEGHTEINTALVASLEAHFRRVGMLQDGWMAHTRLAQILGVPSAEVRGLMRKSSVDIGEGEMRLVRVFDQPYDYDVAYAPRVWRWVWQTSAGR